MSFLFGGGRPQPSSAEKIAAAEQEVELVSDMYKRLTKSCLQKCVPADYREAELNKGESVCLDRCVAKFFEVNIKVSEKMQGEAAARGGAGGGGGGMFGM
ncbi:Tim10/DDP family zinc finger-domain-containing protein [Exophiala viscosa]|uniref:Mitochondrial import inner membrane translocase subunit n=1 Tax=Exophiala viscosa TaxID=2486360 RepID=A0AAN6DMC6_9EURO|nr:Tim10/DDP family zinc finger-domain-containing protein [Exophiala viscosa]KAI1619748.1 Tim10/DDP family zinc finger-domain-containing protein [Exophiala viscosa]